MYCSACQTELHDEKHCPKRLDLDMSPQPKIDPRQQLIKRGICPDCGSPGLDHRH
jgi:RNase P subunit RPR2